MRLAVVTGTLDIDRAYPAIDSWLRYLTCPVSLYVVVQAQRPEAPRVWEQGNTRGPCWWYGTSSILGVVPAFAIGVQKALEDGADIIACLHDDLLIEQDGWDLACVEVMRMRPQVGLVGFGGGTGLGAADIYQTPYSPMQLARQDFVSNMRDAEVHGRRSQLAERVACLDGFSQIGRREFWAGVPFGKPWDPVENLFGQMQSWGVIHHFYDGMLGCFAKRLGWEVWMLPIQVRHLGGQTAVGDARYQQWARLQGDKWDGLTEGTTGDAGFWHRAHEIGYREFKDVLPIRL